MKKVQEKCDSSEMIEEIPSRCSFYGFFVLWNREPSADVLVI